MKKNQISIAEIRMRNNKMTQKEFGEILGVSAQTINAWEKNPGNIKAKYLIKIYEHFGVTAGELLGTD